MKKSIKIANAGGFWGDDPTALYRQLSGGEVDYVTMDFLAEVTMSILQKQKNRDDSRGYAHDFITMLEDSLPLMMEKKVTVITNAGGVNPHGCAEAVRKLAKKLGLNPKIAVIDGDDILGDLDAISSKAPLDNMETGQKLSDVRDRISAANIYLGALPVMDALKSNPDLVITGRVTDTGITVGPMLHEFGWATNDWNKLASGIVAAHILECGSQSTGGNFSDWHLVDSYDNIGFPIVEMHDSGDFFVTKHPGTGGLVSEDTVREQLFYEMGDPSAYITPDVVANFDSIKIESASLNGEPAVRVHGVSGKEPTQFYKVSMAYDDGYKVHCDIVICGPDAIKKADVYKDIFLKKASDALGKDSDIYVEYVGANACQGVLSGFDEPGEIVLRFSTRGQDAAKLKKFAKLIPTLLLAGPAGICVMGGIGRPQEVVSYWPALMEKKLVHPKITDPDGKIFSQEKDVEYGDFEATGLDTTVAESTTKNLKEMLSVGEDLPRFAKICLARSGDKGDMTNLGVLARSPEAYQWIQANVSAQYIKNLFQEFCLGPVKRYELDNLKGLNFLLEDSLDGGGTQSRRIDAQGKTFAQAFLNQRFDIPSDIIKSCT